MDFKEEKIRGDGHVAIHDWAPVNQNGNYKDSSEIENDIYETRHTMDVILDALNDKFNPRSAIDHFLDKYEIPENRRKINEFFSNTAKRLSETVQQNPLPLLFIGIGAAWLLLERQNPQVPYYEKKESPLGEKAREFSEQAQGVAQSRLAEAKKTMQEGIGQIKSKINNGKENVSESLKENISKGRENIQNVQEKIAQKRSEIGLQQRERYQNAGGSLSSLIQDKPLVAGFAAALVGMAAGILIPESRVEKGTVQEPAAKSYENIERKGSEVAAEAKNEAEKSVSNVKDATLKRENIPPNEPVKVDEKKEPVAKPYENIERKRSDVAAEVKNEAEKSVSSVKETALKKENIASKEPVKVDEKKEPVSKKDEKNISMPKDKDIPLA